MSRLLLSSGQLDGPIGSSGAHLERDRPMELRAPAICSGIARHARRRRRPGTATAHGRRQEAHDLPSSGSAAGGSARPPSAADAARAGRFLGSALAAGGCRLGRAHRGGCAGSGWRASQSSRVSSQTMRVASPPTNRPIIMSTSRAPCFSLMRREAWLSWALLSHRQGQPSLPKAYSVTRSAASVIRPLAVEGRVEPEAALVVGLAVVRPQADDADQVGRALLRHQRPMGILASGHLGKGSVDEGRGAVGRVGPRHFGVQPADDLPVGEALLDDRCVLAAQRAQHQARRLKHRGRRHPGRAHFRSRFRWPEGGTCCATPSCGGVGVCSSAVC